MGVFRGLVDAIYPPECAWCQTPTAGMERLCEPCRLRFASDYYCCQTCAAPLPHVLPNERCSRCRQAKWRFSRVIALAPYRGKMRQAVILMKRKRFEPLRRAMADLLGEQLLQLVGTGQSDCELLAEDRTMSSVVPAAGHSDRCSTQPLLLPVPYYWSHHFSTAANTAELLAQGIAARTGWPIALRALGRNRKTSKQGLLTWAERKNNVRHAFSVRRLDAIVGQRLWLIDDVMTSGATVGELASLLLKSGAREVNVAVVARGTGVRESAPSPLPS